MIVRSDNSVTNEYIPIEIILDVIELYANIIMTFLIAILVNAISFIIMMILIITIFLIISLLYVVIIVNDGIFIANLLFLSNVMIDARLNHVMKNHSCLFFIIVFDKFRIFHSAIVTFVVFVVMSYQLIVLDFN